MTAEHRAIVVVDIASFTDPARTLMDQRTVHDGLYDMLRTAFDSSGIHWKNCRVEDRGDGAMILVPAEFPKIWLADQWPTRLLAGLREYNAVHAVQARVQLRVALHAGEVYENSHGVVSQAVNHAFRILDAKPAKSALATTGGMLVLIASNDFYRDVVRQEPAADPNSYRRIAVSVKETETVAWMRLPDGVPQVQVPVRGISPATTLFDIVDALLELPFVRDAGGRSELIDLLRPEIRNTVAHHAIARLHVVALVKTCLRYDRGLADLLEAVRQLDGDSSTVRRLESIKQELSSESVD